MVDTVRVRLFCDWGKTSGQLRADLQRQTLGFIGNVYDEFEFIDGQDYDHAVVFNFPSNPKELRTPPNKNLGLLLEPPEILEHMYPSWVGVESVPGVDNYYSFCSATPFPKALGLGFATTKPNLVPYGWKRRPACMIASNKLYTPYHHRRHEILRALMASDLAIDFYGRGMQVNDDPRVKGEIPPGGKQEVLEQYEYVIDFENSPHGVVTDKFFDAAFSGCTPITNADVLKSLCQVGSYRLVDFDDDLEQIVGGIGSTIYQPRHDLSEQPWVMAAILCGRMSLAKWIVEKLREIRTR